MRPHAPALPVQLPGVGLRALRPRACAELLRASSNALLGVATHPPAFAYNGDGVSIAVLVETLTNSTSFTGKPGIAAPLSVTCPAWPR
jgi:hypothetical protein